jgi:hypothetical protein
MVGWMAISLRLFRGLVAVGAAILVIGGTLSVPRYVLDGLDGWVFSRVLAFGSDPDDTEYGAGYSDEAFARVTLGMTARDVLSLLGPPLETRVLGRARETWQWSRSPSDGSYRMRALVIDTERVIEIHSEFRAD